MLIGGEGHTVTVILLY